jgi:hypothetical protein
MGRASSIYGEKEKFILGFQQGSLNKRNHLEDQGIDRRILLGGCGLD